MRRTVLICTALVAGHLHVTAPAEAGILSQFLKSLGQLFAREVASEGSTVAAEAAAKGVGKAFSDTAADTPVFRKEPHSRYFSKDVATFINSYGKNSKGSYQIVFELKRQHFGSEVTDKLTDIGVFVAGSGRGVCKEMYKHIAKTGVRYALSHASSVSGDTTVSFVESIRSVWQTNSYTLLGQKYQAKFPYGSFDIVVKKTVNGDYVAEATLSTPAVCGLVGKQQWTYRGDKDGLVL